MRWISITTKPDYDKTVLLYDSHKQVGLGWWTKDDLWMWPMGNMMAIRIKDSENQISHWMYPPERASEAWNSITERPPEPGKQLLLYHPQWFRDFSIGYLMSDGRWQLDTATFGRNDLEPFVDENERIRFWMPRPDPPNL